MFPSKSPTTYEEQIEKLRQRGCRIDDEEFCLDCLRRVNYYRLSAYFLPFKRKDGSYIKGTSFRDVFNIYEFDRKMRNVLLLALEEVEVNLRARLAHLHAIEYGSIGYMDQSSYDEKHDHEKFLQDFQREIKHSKSSLVVQHHNNKYGNQFPVWVAVEFFSFGMLSRFFSDLPLVFRTKAAHEIFDCSPGEAQSWLLCCTKLRNACAHYGRLYYGLFSSIPKAIEPPKSSDKYISRRLFLQILALRNLYPSDEKWNNEVANPIAALMTKYEASIKMWHIGFPADWEDKMRR